MKFYICKKSIDILWDVNIIKMSNFILMSRTYLRKKKNKLQNSKCNVSENFLLS